MRPIHEDIVIAQGATWDPVLQWLSETPTHKTISDVTIGLPTLLTVTSHGITGTARVPVWITNVQGPRALNTDGYCAAAQPRWATVVDADTLAVEFDSGSLSDYVRGGVLTYRAPVDLTGWSAEDQMRASVQATDKLFDLTTDNGGITLGSDGTIKRLLSATATAALALVEGIHILELTDSNGTVYRFAEGRACVVPDFPDAST